MNPRAKRTADIVARELASYGLEVHRGLAKTGVVGVLRKGNGPRAIGLRADMDALPVEEKNEFAHCSRHAGRMHACGHDGHTTLLLGAAADDPRVQALFARIADTPMQPARVGTGDVHSVMTVEIWDETTSGSTVWGTAPADAASSSARTLSNR